MDEFLYLWPIYGSALQIIAEQNPALTGSLDNGGNLCVLADKPATAKQALVTSLRVCAKRSYDELTNRATNSFPDAWLVVDVPIPAQVEPRDLLHRMIRRLYFSAVLHGMGEIATFRETVQVLRMAYLQTRGSVSQGRNTETLNQAGVELGGKLGIKPELSAKLSAGDEVRVVETLNAEMARLDLFEAEDELTFDLTILQRLELFADRHAQAMGGGSIPRWEKIRSWFKDIYAPLQTQQGLRLRAAYVFEATSVVKVLSVTRFFAQAAGLASSQSAQILLTGGIELRAAIEADREIGSPVFRDSFDIQQVSDTWPTVSSKQKDLLKTIVQNPPIDWPPEVTAIAKGMDLAWKVKRAPSKSQTKK